MSSSFQTAGNVFTRLFTKRKKLTGSTLEEDQNDKKDDDEEIGVAGLSFEGNALNKLLEGHERSSAMSGRSGAARSKYEFEAINEDDEEKVRSQFDSSSSSDLSHESSEDSASSGDDDEAKETVDELFLDLPKRSKLQRRGTEVYGDKPRAKGNVLKRLSVMLQ